MSLHKCLRTTRSMEELSLVTGVDLLAGVALHQSTMSKARISGMLLVVRVQIM